MMWVMKYVILSDSSVKVLGVGAVFKQHVREGSRAVKSGYLSMIFTQLLSKIGQAAVISQFEQATGEIKDTELEHMIQDVD